MSKLAEYVIEKVKELQEPLGLTGWTIKLEHGQQDDAASCVAMPEYKMATLTFDFDRLQTGDELDEIIVHEMMHLHTWPIFQAADDLANLAADMSPRYMRDAVRRKLLEESRKAGEDSNTQVGFTAIRLLRRLWKAEKALEEAQAELKTLRRKMDKAASSH